MSRHLNNDQWSSLFWLVCGVIFSIGSILHGVGNVNAPGTGFTPFLAGLTISILSGIGLVKSTMERKKGLRWVSPIKGAMWGRAFLTVLALLAYSFLLTPLGFTVCTALCITFLLRVGKRYPWSVAVPGGVITAGATYALFVALLKVQLPRGPWGF